jgi:hypothetical protein
MAIRFEISVSILYAKLLYVKQAPYPIFQVSRILHNPLHYTKSKGADISERWLNIRL